MYKRKLKIEQENGDSYFLWGARQTGKSTLIKSLFPEALRLDLLESDVYQELLSKPQRIREIVAASSSELIIIDEIQKIPILLNEVHALIENKNKAKLEFFNLGTGTGSTVLEVVHAFEDANDLKLKYEIKERRAGDIIEAYANNSLAEKELGWKPETKLSESMRTAWEWQKSLEK